MMLGVPPWSFVGEDSISIPLSPISPTIDDYYESFKALQAYLPSPDRDDTAAAFVDHLDNGNGDLPVDAHSCDRFRMFEFKVRKCGRGKSHDWTDCPFVHPGEKARRRDPKKFHYSANPCPEFRKGSCSKADGCEFAHGVFECWLHPARYRTQPCKDGVSCKRRVCFFAHSPDQLRPLSPRSEAVSSPSESPPMSPMMSSSYNDLVLSLRQLQLNRVKSAISSSWAAAASSPPRMLMTRPGYLSLPTTPTREMFRTGFADPFDVGLLEEPVMERVESGRNLRARMFEKLCKENPLERVEPDPVLDPEVDWVSDLVN